MSLRTACLVATACVLMDGSSRAVAPTAEELADARRWAADHLGGDTAGLPFSFVLAGRPSSEFLKDWTLHRSGAAMDEQRTRQVTDQIGREAFRAVNCSMIQRSMSESIRGAI